jgi:hypothetical protein
MVASYADLEDAKLDNFVESENEVLSQISG